MKAFESFWLEYTTRNPILTQPKIRIKTTSLKAVAEAAHKEGNRQEHFDVFWLELEVKNGLLKSNSLEMTAGAVKKVAQYAFNPVQEKNGMDKVKESIGDLFQELADLATKKAHNGLDKIALEKFLCVKTPTNTFYMEPVFSPLPDFGDLFSLEEVEALTNDHAIIDDDGIGYYTKVDLESDVPFIPSQFLQCNKHPDWATGVMWYNK